MTDDYGSISGKRRQILAQAKPGSRAGPASYPKDSADSRRG